MWIKAKDGHGLDESVNMDNVTDFYDAGGGFTIFETNSGRKVILEIDKKQVDDIIKNHGTTPVDMARALNSIQHYHHPLDNKIYYFEADLLQMFKRLGLPEPDYDGMMAEDGSR